MKNEAVRILIALIIVTVVYLTAEGLATGAHALQGGSLADDALPVPVDVGIFVIDVSEVDDASQTFRVDFHLSARWHDEQLADPDSNRIRRLALADVWHPQLGIRNRRNVELLFPMEVEVDRDGNAHYRQRISGELSARLDLRDFPFDRQVLPIEVVSLRYGPEEVSLEVDAGRTGSLDRFTLPGWDVELGEARSSDVQLAAQGRALSQIELPIHVNRQVAYYRWTMLAPLVLLVLMAWSVFWIDPSLLPSQLAVSTTSVFALIAFRLSMRDLLPPVPYMTRSERLPAGLHAPRFLGLRSGRAHGTTGQGRAGESRPHAGRMEPMDLPGCFRPSVLADGVVRPQG